MNFRYKKIHQQHNLPLRPYKRQPGEQHSGGMLKVTSRELASIWLAGPLQTLLVSSQQHGQSPAVDRKTPDANTASSNSFINLALYAIHLFIL